MKYIAATLASLFVLVSCTGNAFDLSRCRRIPAQESREFVRQMELEGLTGIRYIMAVRSTEVDYWFVAMDLEGASLESPTDIAVWATKTIEPFVGPFTPADELAIRYSSHVGAAQEMLFPPDTDGIADAVRCSRYIGAQ